MAGPALLRSPPARLPAPMPRASSLLPVTTNRRPEAPTKRREGDDAANNNNDDDSQWEDTVLNDDNIAPDPPFNDDNTAPIQPPSPIESDTDSIEWQGVATATHQNVLGVLTPPFLPQRPVIEIDPNAALKDISLLQSARLRESKHLIELLIPC